MARSYLKYLLQRKTEFSIHSPFVYEFMKKVLYDFHLAQAMVEDLPYDQREKANAYINAVFEKHGITKEDFDSAVVWYNSHNEDLQDIYKDLQTQYTQEQEQLQLTTGNDAVAAFITEGGDTANIWVDRTTMALMP